MIDEKKVFQHTDNHKARGHWNPLWEQFRELDPAAAAADRAFNEGQWPQLSPAERGNRSYVDEYLKRGTDKSVRCTVISPL